jgi:hypothetical protein
MQTLTAGFTIEKNKKTGAKPAWILKIPFVAGTLYLSDRVLTYTGITVKPWISSWGKISENIAGGSASPRVSDFSASIIIDPAEATDIHDLLWSESGETLDCELHHWYEGLTVATDPMILKWTGNITDFSKADELRCPVEFVDQGVKWDKYPGRVLSLADYTDANLADVGKQLNILYGTVANVPAHRVDDGLHTSLKDAITALTTNFNLTSGTGLAANSIIMAGTGKIKILAITGANITSCYRGWNSAGVGTFGKIIVGVTATWDAICAAPNGDVYAAAGAGAGTDNYKQTGGVGNFNALSQGALNWSSLCAAPNGNIYACVSGGDIYMQTNGAGAFSALSQTSRSWDGLCAAPNGDVYACAGGVDIYMQTNGAGDFNPLSQGSLDWYALAAAPNGDIYAVVYGGDIYKRANGAGDFVALSQTSRNWTGITAAPNGDIYACVYGGGVYRRAAGAGDFVSINQISRNWYAIAATPNNTIYAIEYNVDVWTLPGTATTHEIGDAVSEIGVTVHMAADHPMKAIDNVYGQESGKPPVDITSLCTLYTGQGGANDLAGYAGKAVVSVTLPVNLSNMPLLFSGKGYQDDGGGTYTGTGSALIERPDHVFKHYLYTYASLAVANFSTDTATPFAAKSYAFSAVINKRQKNRAWLADMARQCRSWFRFANSKAYLLYRPDSLTSDKTIPKFADNSDHTTTMQISRSPLSEIINKVTVHYNRDWSLSGGRDAYQANTTASDATSITAYGEKENPDLFLYDFVTLSAMATDLRDFELARRKDRKKDISGDLYLDHVELEFADAVTLTEAGGLLCEVRKVGVSPGAGNQMDKLTLEAREY